MKQCKTWPTVWRHASPRQYLGAIIEIWHTNPHTNYRTVFRVKVHGVTPQSEDPFELQDWIKFNRRMRRFDPAKEPDLHYLLRMTPGDGLSMVEVDNNEIVQAHPAVNVHVIIFKIGQKIPKKPVRALTRRQAFALMNRALKSPLVHPAKNGARKKA